jgi:hypothetical protein
LEELLYILLKKNNLNILREYLINNHLELNENTEKSFIGDVGFIPNETSIQEHFNSYKNLKVIEEKVENSGLTKNFFQPRIKVEGTK